MSIINRIRTEMLVHQYMKDMEKVSQESNPDTINTETAELTEEQKNKCHAIIHSAAASAGVVGTGLAQLPLSDTAIITPVQIAMIIALGKVFDIRITESAAKGILSTCATSIIGRGISQVLLGWIPVLGNAINTATAAGITEAAGWAAVKHFQKISQQDIARGMKAGYEAASAEYEQKLRNQANEFISQKELSEEQIDRYQKLCEEYEEYIITIEAKLSKQEEEIDSLDYMKEQYSKLIELGKHGDQI